jgi:hypothetical protein
MLIFLILTLQSFAPEYFVPLVQIEIFQNGLIEENESYKMVHYTQPTCNSSWEKVVKDKNPHELMHQPNTFHYVASSERVKNIPTL